MINLSKTKYALSALTISAIAVLAIACNSDGGSSENTVTPVPVENSAATLLEESRSLWESLDLADYDFVTNWQCFCLREYTASVELSVRDGEITTGEYLPESGLTSTVDPTRYETVDGLFEFIADAIERDAHSIQVTYHPEQGYPESAFIDYNEMMADEERGFNVTTVSADISGTP